ncbi:MAG: hypothetical protein ACOCVM_03515 [Desulfovibrionaceae bacterium]
MQAAGSMTLFVVLFFVLSVLAGAVVVHVAARLAKVPDSRFVKAVKAVILNALASLLVSVVLTSLVPVAGTALGFIISLLVTLWILRAIYKTTWGKAALMWIFQWVIMVVIGLLLGASMGVAFL